MILAEPSKSERTAAKGALTATKYSSKIIKAGALL
jgi:hypothetical protein